MTWLADKTLDHLRGVLDTPDLTGTKYRVVRKLARGGMGTVYVAEDAELDRRVALKVLNLVDSSGEAVARMLREARILARLEHPGIVPVHDVRTLPDGRIFYAMKLVDGARLDRFLDTTTSLPDLLRVFQKACEAVAFAHSHGVIHRDLKPENIMVGAFGEVLVMDWGVAKWLRGPAPDGPATCTPAAPAGEDSATAYGTVVGTPAYMAPEQANGQVDRVDERSDVYGLGAILYFLLTRRAPHDRGLAPLNPRRWNPSAPRAIEAVCLKAMAADPGERYESVQHLQADVARFLDGLPVRAYREGVLERAARVLSRNRTLVVLILAYLVMRTLLLFFARR